MSETRSWSRHSLAELIVTYQTDIHPEFEASAQAENRAYPTAEWLREHGYSGIRYALREHHDRTLTEFLQDDVGLAVDDTDGERRCGIRDELTEHQVDRYFSRRESRGQLAESTLASRQTRFSRWVGEYHDIHGDDALVDHATGDRKEVEHERVLRVLDRIEADLGTDGSRVTFLADVRTVYSWLHERAGAIDFNPLSGIESEYNWDVDYDNPAVDAQDVSALVDAAETRREEILVTALAGWGLRTNEVAALHVNQFELDGDDPHIYFGEDRKNGASSVAIIYGRDIANEWVRTLASERTDWNGHLFPSVRGSSGHISPDTVRNRFRRLAERADVTVAGATPTPKMGRRFWYSSFSSAMSEVMGSLQPVAEAQGAESVRVIWDNYLDEQERRNRRRSAMRGRLEAAFPVSNDV